ncbi:MAG: cation:dicarboxylase symporter family transporter, partial [Clostridia bacterium]|nr:cation:dicarboxylase symporter family transporter [Clostridia bacterium]
MSEQKKTKFGLVPRLLLGIVLGLIVGSFVNEPVIRVFTTVANIFAQYLGFIIPLLIISFVTAGIAQLAAGGAGRLLGFTVLLAYC